MANKKIFVIFGCMFIALAIAYWIDGSPKKVMERSYNPTNFSSTKKMFDQHYKAYDKLVQFFMERKVEARIEFDEKGNLTGLNL